MAHPIPPHSDRDVSLLIYHENGPKLTPDHWVLFIPSKNDFDQGKKIHAFGTPFTGYQLEIKEYDISKPEIPLKRFPLGVMDEVLLQRLDDIAKGVKPPGVSKVPLDPFGVSEFAF